jgi:hypothetical protein
MSANLDLVPRDRRMTLIISASAGIYLNVKASWQSRNQGVSSGVLSFIHFHLIEDSLVITLILFQHHVALSCHIELH